MNIINENLDKIKRWYTTDVGLLIYSIIKLNEASSYLELGVGHGYTLICAGLALKQNKLKAYQLYGIEAKQNRVNYVNNELNKYGLSGIVYQGDASNYNWEKTIDVLFIDSGHREMQNNINRYAPYVKKTFICHDIFNKFEFPDDFKEIYFKESKIVIAHKL